MITELQDEIPKLKQSGNPELIAFMIGTNNVVCDKPETIVASYKALVDLTLKTMPESQIIIHRLDFDRTIYDYNPTIDWVNTQLESTLAGGKVHFINNMDTTKDITKVLHPSDKLQPGS